MFTVNSCTTEDLFNKPSNSNYNSPMFIGQDLPINGKKDDQISGKIKVWSRYLRYELGAKKRTYKHLYVLQNLYERLYVRSYVLPNSHKCASVLPNLYVRLYVLQNGYVRSYVKKHTKNCDTIYPTPRTPSSLTWAPQTRLFFNVLFNSLIL